MSELSSVIGILFVLSLVCERVAELLKNFLSEITIFNFQIIGDTVTKGPPESPQELTRQYRILKLNLFCGFVTALLCHTSLFQILSNLNDPSKVMGWSEEFKWSDYEYGIKYLPRNLWFLFGCVLTGAFLSLGSKFWHDVLDIIVVAKDAKRINTPKLVGDFDALKEDEQMKRLSAAIDNKSLVWKKTFKNYRGVSVAKKQSPTAQDGKLVLRFNVEKKENFTTIEPNRIPPFIYSDGYNLPTDIEPTGIASGGDGPVVSTTHPRELGTSIGREDAGNSGTLGVLMSKNDGANNEYYAASCFHVLFPEELRKLIFEIASVDDNNILNSKKITSPSEKDGGGKFEEIGIVEQGTFNKYLDVAFFKTGLRTVKNFVFQIGAVEGKYDLSSTDLGLTVTMCGRSSGPIDGVVESIKAHPVVKYFDKFDHEFEDFIQIRMKGAKGDSGAAVMTKDKKLVVGIVVALDDLFVYALPISYIFNNFQYQLVTQKPAV